jgi:hypothetical protein
MAQEVRSDAVAAVASLILNVGSFACSHDVEQFEVPLDASVDTVIATCPGLEESDGFLVTAKQTREDYGGYSDDDEPEPVSSGLAEKLAGSLLQRGMTLASYGLDGASCREVTLFAVFSEKAKQPTVFKKDIEEMGFGANVYDFVKLHSEDKEIVVARTYFSAPILPWLQKKQPAGEDGGLKQTVAFSMEDNFPQAPKPILTVHITQDGGELEASCTNMAGDVVCCVKVPGDDTIAGLRSSLCEKLMWSSMALWDGSEKVPEASQSSKYSLLTAERTSMIENVGGCYQNHEKGVHPAGYSSSGTSFANMLVLEPGKACVQHHFRGDYKRAEELLKMEMIDARWSIESLGDGKDVVQVVGKAKLDRYWVHERSGSDGDKINGYECYALVTIPLQQLENGQGEDRHTHSTQGSGWTCGSEEYRCSFFLPSSLLSALRVKPEGEEDAFLLRHFLNQGGSLNYPYNQMAAGGMCGWRRQVISEIPQEAYDMLGHFRQGLAGKVDVTMEEIMQLQVSALKA